MSKKPFEGIDEFTSHRIRKDVGRNSALLDAGLSREVVIAAETRLLASVDPMAVAAQCENTTDPSMGSHLHAIRMKKAMLAARLEGLGDLRDGMTPEEVLSWMEKTSFVPAHVESIDGGRGIFAVWGDPETGIVVYGQVYEYGRLELTMSCQWSPNLDSMTETEESRLNLRLQNILGRDQLTHSWFNPARPHLNHSTLHYARSYPDIAGEEKLAWEEDYRKVPPSILKERGKWVALLSWPVRIGIATPLDALVSMGGLFQPRWHPNDESADQAKAVFARGHRPETAADWLREIVMDAYSFRA